MLCALLLLLGAFQLALVAGAPMGHLAWGGQQRVLPRRLRIGSALGIVVYVAIGVLALEKADVIDLFGDAGWVDVAIWIAVAFFAASIVLNAISRSRPERLVMTPVVAALTALAVLVALS
jgi:hypothetical protein